MSRQNWLALSVVMIASVAVGIAGCGKASDTDLSTTTQASDEHSHEGWWCPEHGVPEEVCACAAQRSRPNLRPSATGVSCTIAPSRNASSAILKKRPNSRPSTKRSLARNPRSQRRFERFASGRLHVANRGCRHQIGVGDNCTDFEPAVVVWHNWLGIMPTRSWRGLGC